MADEVQKLPYALSLNKAIQKKIVDAMQQSGKALPCKVVDVAGSIVTVSFEVDTTQADGTTITLPKVTIPMFGPEYIRYPTQVGDLGVAFPASVRLGGITALGTGLAKLFSTPGNLSTLVFFPIASKNWSATDDPNALVMYGPNGFVLRDAGKNCSIVGDTENVTITAKTTLTLQVGSVSIVINSSGVAINGNLTATGGITAGQGTGDQVTLQHHKHGTGTAAAGTSVPTPGL